MNLVNGNKKIWYPGIFPDHDKKDNNFTQVPLPPMQKKRANKRPAPSSDSNDSSSCEEAVDGPSMGKGGVKMPKQLSKAEDK